MRYDQRCVHVVVHGIVAAFAQLRHVYCCFAVGSEAVECVERVCQALQTLLRCLQGIVTEVYSATVVCLQDEETDGHGRVCLCQQFVCALKELREGDEVAERLAHLCAVDGNHVVVHPIFYHLMSHGCHSLCYLALVVGEYKVHASAVDVELLAEVFASHGCALAVPSGEAVAPGRWPTHDVFGLCAFP